MNSKFYFDNTEVAFKSKSDFELRKATVLFALMNRNWIAKIGTFFIKLMLLLHFPIKKLLKITLFNQFCGGEDLLECQNKIKELYQNKIGTILDYSVEGEDSELDYEKTAQEIKKTIAIAAQELAVPYAVFKVTGIGSKDLLERIANNEILNETEERSLDLLQKRLENLALFAFENNTKLLIDAEESWIQDPIDHWAEALMEKYNKEKAVIFNTYQMYRVDKLLGLQQDIKKAEAKGYKLGVKLVRGAYIEKEREMAHTLNHADPIHISKSATDADFDSAVKLCLFHIDSVEICLGTHNQESCQLMMELMEQKSLPNNFESIYFAQLLGMADNISYNLANLGYNVAKYVPYGPVQSVMPYLFRRAEENTSVAGQTSREYELHLKESNRRRVQKQ